jgi:PhnB protein
MTEFQMKGEIFMADKVKHVPEGFHAVNAVLVVNGAAQAIEFYKTAFGAKERTRLTGPGEKIVHAEMAIGDAVFMVKDEFPEWDDRGPKLTEGSPVRIALYIEDVDELAKRAVDAGAKILIPVADQFYGDRSGRLADPFGHIWIISTHKEDVSAGEMKRRMDALSKKS